MKPNLHEPANDDRSTLAFTLMELFVVVAVVALLVAVLLPAQARTAPTSKAFQCMNNLKQLQMGWLMYAQDNADRIVNNYNTSATQLEINIGTFRNWVNDILSFDSGSIPDLDPMNTNTAYIRNGTLAPYVKKDVRLYKCPADNFLCSHQRAAGWTSRVRSVSINACFGAPTPSWNKPNGDFYTQDTRQWYKTTQVSRPSWFWVMVEEHPDSINDGRMIDDISPYLHNNANIPAFWNDFPSPFHDGGTAISFMDGRVEIHKWRSGVTRDVKYLDWSPTVASAAGQADIIWFYERTGILYVP